MELAYSKGNEAYKSNQYDLAFSYYSEGIDCIEKTSSHSISNPEDYKEMKVKLLLNRAQCSLVLRDYDMALKDCNSILLLDADSPKGLLRRAIVYEAIGNFAGAASDIRHFLSSSSGSSLSTASKDKYLKTVRRLEALHYSDSKISSQQGVPMSLITEFQVLRLVLSEMPKQRIVIKDKSSSSQKMLLKACIRNEFGLWSRKLMQISSSSTEERVAQINVCCEAIPFNTACSSFEFAFRPGAVGEDGKVRSNSICINLFH
jgi:tetratricopeptide (TPR) repeat protein